MNKLNDILYNTEHNDINHLITKFIKKNIDDIENMTIDELARACFVSKAKISKFCKTLGYDNFIAFKDDCAKEMKTKKLVLENQKYNLDVEFQEHIHNSLKTLENNLCLIDYHIINSLVNEINEAQYIFMYGVAYSNLLCQYMQYGCDFLDKEVIVLDEKLKKDYVMKEKSLLIVISVDGHALEHDHRLFYKLMKYPVKKWIISTDRIQKHFLNNFDNSLIIPSLKTDSKERSLLIRYVIDMILGRYQYMYY